MGFVVSAKCTQVKTFCADEISIQYHSSLTYIYERNGVEVCRLFFEKIVEQCQQAGFWPGLLLQRVWAQCYQGYKRAGGSVLRKGSLWEIR